MNFTHVDTSDDGFPVLQSDFHAMLARPNMRHFNWLGVNDSWNQLESLGIRWTLTTSSIINMITSYINQ